MVGRAFTVTVVVPVTVQPDPEPVTVTEYMPDIAVVTLLNTG